MSLLTDLLIALTIPFIIGFTIIITAAITILGAMAAALTLKKIYDTIFK